MSEVDSGMDNKQANPEVPKNEDAGNSRRGFGAKVTAVFLGIAAFTGPVCAAVVSFFNPLKLKSQGGRFFFLTTLESLPEDGTPRRFPVIADRVDAWNVYPDEPIGAVLMRRTDDKKKPVEAFNEICPHAGCFIGYSPDKKEFLCPCHLAHFALDGKRTDKNSPSPRDMDTLEVEIRNKNEIWVKFENFQLGCSEKIAKV